jgi:2,4-dienoyl-CoA reductase-like NADH-dependent reductase (Old Yellow Enzyme family)
MPSSPASPDSAASLAALRAPLTLASGAALPNRLVKAAMSETLAELGSGAPTEELVRLYARWGKGGAAALITGNVMIDRDATGEPGQVVVEDDRHLAMLRRWAEAGRAGGSKLWMQLNHAGRQTPRRLSRDPVAPSAVPMRGFFGAFKTPRALEGQEIERVITRFATTAAVARAAGFDGVELHAAHGYLISQFLSPLTNLRDDEWGGDPARRRRFLLEVVRAVRAATAPDFTIAVKLNSADFQRGGFEVGEAKEVARALEAEGIDLLEISGGTYERPAMTGTVAAALPGKDGGAAAKVKASTAAREAYFLEYAAELRTATKLPLMLTGGLRSAAAMAQGGGLRRGRRGRPGAAAGVPARAAGPPARRQRRRRRADRVLHRRDQARWARRARLVPAPDEAAGRRPGAGRLARRLGRAVDRPAPHVPPDPQGQGGAARRRRGRGGVSAQR